MGQYEELLERQRDEAFPAIVGAARRLRWSAARLAAERENRLRSLLSHAAAGSPYWSRRLSGCDLEAFTEEDLSLLPVLTKDDLIENFDEILTDRSLNWRRVSEHIDHLEEDAYLDGRYRVLSTSGSEGRRALIVYGWEEWITFVAMLSRWHELRVGDPAASIGSTFSRNPRHVAGALHAFWLESPEESARVTHLPATLSLPEIVAGLNEARPAVLQGYPSMIQLLANEARAGRLEIAPRHVSTCGEQCTGQLREMVRATWGADLYDYWGSTEGVYAFPCAAGPAMHLPDDFTIVEPVDNDYKPVAYGEPADRILLTNLYNKTQPLIRYEITDAMTISDEACGCGCAHRRITELRGRSGSVFFYDNGAAVHWVPMTTVLLSDPAVAEMQVTQTRRGAAVSLVTRAPCDTERLRLALTELMARSGVAEPEVTVGEVDSLQRMWSGKLKRFEPLSVAS